MVAIVASLRKLPLLGSVHLSPRLWWAPAAALILVVVAGGVISGRSPAGYSLAWAQILLLGLAVSARRRGLHVRTMPLDRVLLWAVFGLVILDEVSGAGLVLRDWDVLFDTGVLAFIVAVELEDQLPRRLTSAVMRLVDRGVLVMNRDARSRAGLQVEPRGGKRAWVGGPIVSAVILLAWMVPLVSIAGFGKVFTHIFAVLFYPPLIFECLCGWIAGVRIAHMVAVGRSWRSLMRDSAGWRLIPGHPDGAGGFKPIGDFYFYQCLIAGIPAAYLGVWLWLIPFVRHFHSYELWLEPYIFLLIVAIVLEIVVFVLPMRSIHGIMRQEKDKLLSRADRLSVRIDSMQRQLRGSVRSRQNYQQASDSIMELKEECKRIERAPTWPIDSSIRRRFNLGNVALFLPLLGYVVGGKSLWQAISNALQGIR